MPTAVATVEDLKIDLAVVEAVLRIHIQAIGPIDDAFPDTLKALLQSDLGMQLYADKVNAWTQKQNTPGPIRAAR